MDNNKIILGWESEDKQTQIGFNSAEKSELFKRKPIYHDGNSHLVTIARTGSGKGVSSVIPNLLNYEGSCVVLDIKGELASVTASKRKQFGKVIEICPFSSTKKSDSFNPLDLRQLCPDIEITSQFLASLLCGAQSFSKEPFWDQQGKSVLASIIAIVLSDSNLENKNLREVSKILFANDALYTLAQILDNRNDIPLMAYQNISVLLQTTDVTRSGIISTCQSFLKAINSERILNSLEKSSISLTDFQKSDEAVTIFINIPSAYLVSHSSYIKTIVGTLMHAITTRTSKPQHSTLFILDEAASLGTFEFLGTMISLGRGMGLITHTLWQDYSQIQANYTDYQSIINNSTLQIFGVGTHLAARNLGEVVGLSPQKILSLSKDEQIIVSEGGTISFSEKLNYLKDMAFGNLFDRNPLINNQIQINR